jgi:hypothetical protein
MFNQLKNLFKPKEQKSIADLMKPISELEKKPKEYNLKKTLIDYLKKYHSIKVSKEIIMFGIRGATPNDGRLIENSQLFNKYDDTIGIFNNEFILTYTGTVEPGKKYTINPMNHNGAFYLKNGLYQAQRAKHFGNDAFNIFAKYPKGRVEGYRDISRKGQPDKNKIFYDATGIDIHAGGENINNIDGWSAGCQVLLNNWKSKEWNDFYKSSFTVPTQKIFLYLLIDYSDIKQNYEA